MKFKVCLILLFLIFTNTSASFAEETIFVPSQEGVVNEPVQEAVVEKNIVVPQFTEQTSKFDASLNDSNIHDLIFSSSQSFALNKDMKNDSATILKQFFESMERFSQSNVTVAYKGFNSIIDDNSQNDFCYMFMAYKLTDIGFFSLADLAMNKVQDRQVWQKYIDSIKKSYFPEYKLDYEDEMFFANIYTSINYNNLTRESIADVMKRDKIIKRSDYANYLVANALYIDKDYTKSLIFINRAISIDSNNIYYLKLKARILYDQEKYDDALAVINSLDSRNILYSDSLNEINQIKYLILSKSEKNSLKARYYLAYYFYLNKDYPKALKELSFIIPKNKLPEASNLAGNIYFSNKEYDKSLENYEKTIKIDKRYAPSYKGIANLYVLKKDYANAQKYYLKAYKYDRNDADTLVDLSLICFVTKDVQGAKEYCDKAFSANPDFYKAYYLQAKIKPERAVLSLKKASESNPFYSNSWLDMADNALAERNINAAQSYVDSVRFLDENSYRYYYYAGLIAKMNSDNETASRNFSKSIDLFSLKNEQFFNIPTANIKEF